MRRLLVVLALPIAILVAFAAGTASAGGPTVEVGDIWYCAPPGPTAADDCEVTIEVGDTVTWDFGPATNFPHTVTACGANCDSPTGSPLFDSGKVNPGDADQTYEYTFNLPGEYLYYCEYHPFQQRGRVIVQGGAGGETGDVNGDGMINPIDAALILQFAAGLIGSLPSMERADTNQDGTVNPIDAALILQLVAGLIDEFP